MPVRSVIVGVPVRDGIVDFCFWVFFPDKFEKIYCRCLQRFFGMFTVVVDSADDDDFCDFCIFALIDKARRKRFSFFPAD